MDGDINNKMKKNRGKKTIENYQILEVLQEYEQEYTILLGKNLSDHKQYVLKKLSLRSGSEALYHALLNQAKILKLVKHENIVTCFRMFKTNSNLYIVYNYQESNTLDEVLEVGPKVLTFAQKQTIAKQLCLAISELHKNLVVHLNINPESIYLQKKFHLTLREFMFSMEIPEDGELDVKRKVPKSQFVAPEVKRGIACPEGDVYSFGKVLEKLEFGKCKKDSSSGDNGKRLKQFMTMIEGMTHKDRHNRWTITDVYQCIFSKLKKVKRLKSLSQNIVGVSRLTSHSLASSSSVSNATSSKAISEITMKILHQRSMSELLVQLFKTVAVTLKFNSEYTVILGVLFLKKSTKMLANLGKYLHYGKNDIQIDINYKDYGKFSKSADYFKLCELLDKEVSLQKKQFELAAQTIFNHNSNLLKKDEFNKEMRDQRIDAGYLGDCAREYLRLLVAKAGYLGDLGEEVLRDLVLVSYVACSISFEVFFRSSFSIYKSELQEQDFMKKIRSMPRAVLTQTIKQNIESGITITEVARDTRDSIAKSGVSKESKDSKESKGEELKEETIQI